MGPRLTPEYFGIEELVVNTMNVKCPGAMAAIQIHISTPPPQYFTVGMKWLCWYGASVLANVVLCIMAKISTLLLFDQRGIVPEV